MALGSRAAASTSSTVFPTTQAPNASICSNHSLPMALAFDYFVFNESERHQQATIDIESIIRAERLRTDIQDQVKRLDDLVASLNEVYDYNA